MSTKNRIAVAILVLATLATIASLFISSSTRSERRLADDVATPRSGLEGPPAAPVAIDEGMARPGSDDDRVPAAESKLESEASPRVVARRVAEGIVVELSATAVPDVPLVFRAREAAEARTGGEIRSDTGGRFRFEIPDQAGSLTAGSGP